MKSNLANIPARTRPVVLFAALFVLSVLITLFVLLSGNADSPDRPEAAGVPASSVESIIEEFSAGGLESEALAGVRSSGGDPLGVQDFILPQTVVADRRAPYLLRQRLDRWREEQVARFWIPLEDIALDLIRRENDRRIEKLFEDIP